MCREALIGCVDQLMAHRMTQNKLDATYNDFAKIIHDDIDKYVTFVDIRPHLKNRHKDDDAQLSDSEYDSFLNQTITIDKLNRVIAKAKQRKACGVDTIPNEILKLGRTNEVLLSLFNTCFVHHMIPSEWHRIIINQLPRPAISKEFERNKLNIDSGQIIH